LAQWENAKEEIPTEKKIVQKAPAKISSDGKKKLSWNEQRELEKMEEAIGKAEAEVEVLQTRVGDPTVLVDHIKMHEACEKLAAGQREVERLYTRWTELESRKG
jgi:ABC transport system ATP-binding/permease protein